jgi:hypothetical protein
LGMLGRNAMSGRVVPGTRQDGEPMDRDIRPVSITFDAAYRIQALGPMVVARNLADPQRPTWHDPLALRDAFTGVLKLCRSQRM